MNLWTLTLLLTIGLISKRFKVAAQTSSKHPLTPLDPYEIQSTTNFIKEKFPNFKIVFIRVNLEEPPKSLVKPYLAKISKEGADKQHEIPRRSRTTIIDVTTSKGYEVTVNLANILTLQSIKEFPEDIQPTLTDYDIKIVINASYKDENVVKRLLDLGLESELIANDVWDIRFYWDSKLKTKRLVQLYLYFKHFEFDNEFAHPINFLPVIDVHAGKVIFIEELPIYANFSRPMETKLKLPTKSSNYNPKILGKDFYRKNIKPIKISSIGGPSFQIIDKYEVRWQKFKFRIGFNAREGLILYDVSYKEKQNKKARSILYRASIPELFVPYGDPRPPFHKKVTFDFSDSGGMLNSLVKGKDCNSVNAHYIDAVINNELGQPVLIPNAICLYEVDGGILHKHTDAEGRVTIARAINLIVQTAVTVVNYDYILSWTFGQDASIKFEAKMTGLLSTNLLADGITKTSWGTVVSPQIDAQHHQHLFCARLDMDVDGESNTVSTFDVHPINSLINQDPLEQGFITEETFLKSELNAITDTSMETDRTWKISNSNSLNPSTHKPVAWKLTPCNNNALLLAIPGSDAWKIGQFASHAIWVTKYAEGELYPAGEFLNRHKGDTGGLFEYTKNNETIHNKDVVVWHQFGKTHIPRPEEYPLMATETLGFTLKPCNFFALYPGLDVPPPPQNDKKLV